MTLSNHQHLCPACGAAVSGGRAGCQALLDELQTLVYRDARYGSQRDLAFDTYCMQHLETYCRSAKSYAAHLTRLCCGLAYEGSPRVYGAIQSWLNGIVPLDKPAAPLSRGELTIVDVFNGRAAVPIEHNRRVRAWAEAVWLAYGAQHALAHSWIEAALRNSGSSQPE